MRRAWMPVVLALTGCVALAVPSGPWPCASDADCTGGETCQGTGRCHPPGYCQSDDDCDTTHARIDSMCTAGPCTDDDASCAPYICSHGTCEASCTTNGDCQQGYGCGAGACVAACTSDAQCGNYRCVAAGCVTACASDTDCAAGSLCDDSACAPRACTAGSTGKCDGFACQGGTCATSCSGATGCDPGLTCAADGSCECDDTPGACGGYACEGVACLTSCTGDSDCDSVHTCHDGSCLACAGTALACASQSTCSASGCATSQVCVGTIDCSAFDNAEDNCGLYAGCVWDASTFDCDGSSSCGANVGDCDPDLGCSMASGCTGTPTPCQDLSLTECAQTSGCSVQ